jgi:quercetin dioxygenase-like cupin family protein
MMDRLKKQTALGSRSMRRYAPIAALAFALAAPAYATPAFGFTSQTFRGKISENVSAHQWNPGPLFTVLVQSSSDQWGLDVVQGTTEFAAVDSTGRPAQSGWHDHPTALSIGLVIQGTVWSQAAGSNCLRAIPVGSVFFERSGEIHNNYNLDARTPAIVRIIHFVDRSQSATRRDQPDPITGSTTAATPPPPPCLADAAGGGSHSASITGSAPVSAATAAGLAVANDYSEFQSARFTTGDQVKEPTRTESVESTPRPLPMSEAGRVAEFMPVAYRQNAHSRVQKARPLRH